MAGKDEGEVFLNDRISKLTRDLQVLECEMSGIAGDLVAQSAGRPARLLSDRLITFSSNVHDVSEKLKSATGIYDKMVEHEELPEYDPD